MQRVTRLKAKVKAIEISEAFKANEAGIERARKAGMSGTWRLYWTNLNFFLTRIRYGIIPWTTEARIKKIISGTPLIFRIAKTMEHRAQIT